MYLFSMTYMQMLECKEKLIKSTVWGWILVVIGIPKIKELTMELKSACVFHRGKEYNICWGGCQVCFYYRWRHAYLCYYSLAMSLMSYIQEKMDDLGKSHPRLPRWKSVIAKRIAISNFFSLYFKSKAKNNIHSYPSIITSISKWI